MGLFGENSPFIWGENGEMMTPDQVARKRKMADLARSRMGDTSPVGHWTQGATRLVDAFGGVLNERRADRGETAGLASADEYVSNDSVLSALIGRGGGMSPRAVAPQPASMGDDMRMGSAGEDTLGVPADQSADSDLRLLLARTMQAEAGNEGLQGMIDVGAVMRNREASGRYGEGLDGVIMRPGQFSAWNSTTGYAGGEQGQDMSFTPNADALRAADTVLSGNYEDQTGGATHYVNYNVSQPSWFNDSFQRRGNHWFGDGDSAGAVNGNTGPISGGAGNAQMTGQQGNDYISARQDNSNIIAALTAGMSDPWVAEKYGPVIQGLLGQQMRRGDMQYQQQMQQSDPMYQAQLAQLTAPAQVDPMDAINLEMAQMDLNERRNPVAQTPDAPTTQTIFDPETGREQRVQWNGSDWIPLGGVEADSGPMVTVENNMPGQNKFDEAFASGDAAALATVSDSGMAAQRNIPRIDQLEAVLQSSPSGFAAAAALKAGEWGINTEGLDDLQAAQALINSMVPEQRQPGSGPMSDADLALFKQSLPRIINQPGGNEQIIGAMRAIAQYDAEGAAIVQRARAGELTRAEAFQALQGRVNPLQGFGAPQQPSAPPTASPAQPQNQSVTVEMIQSMNATEINGYITTTPPEDIPRDVLDAIIAMAAE